MTLDEVKDLLTPASVWLRRDGAQVKALFLTNQILTKAQQEKYPPQVVYADADGNVLSRDLQSFASLYTFLNVDPDLEKRLSNLIVFKATDFLTVDDPEDDEEVSLTDDTKPAEEEKPIAKEKPVVEVRQPSKQKAFAEAEQKSPTLAVDFKMSANDGYTDPKLSANELTAACKIYTRQPDEHYKMMVHRLSFELSDTITIDALKEAFHPSSTVNTVDAFRVRTHHDKEVFVWDSWIGIFPEYSVSSLYATVYVGTSDVSPVDTEETPGAETVNVSAEPAQPNSTAGQVQAESALTFDGNGGLHLDTMTASDPTTLLQNSQVTSFDANGGVGPVTLTEADIVPPVQSADPSPQPAQENLSVPPLATVPAEPVQNATIPTPVVQVQVQPQVTVSAAQ